MNRIAFSLPTLFFIAFLLALTPAAFAQTTQFTYQGSLNTGGSPANGSFDFEFVLYSVLSGGSPIGSNFISPNVTVTNGVFAVTINFGPNFAGPDRFLEVHVRPAGGGAFTVLSPRQRITSEPYAINAAQLGGISASQYVLSGANIINAAAQFSIGGDRVLSTGGTANTFVGVGAGANASALAENNAVFGTNAGMTMTVAGGNAFFGSEAGMSATSGGDSFFGFQAGRLTTTGDSNSFFGNGAGRANTTGSNNAFFGRAAGFVNQTGSGNSYFGYQAGSSSNTGNNSFFGYQSGKSATGINNSFFGWSSGLSTTTGTNNSFFGVQAGLNNDVGFRNVFMGRDAGISNTTGNNNTVIGSGANVGAAGLTYATAIGSDAVVSNSNSIVLGRSSDKVRVPGDMNVSGDLNVTGFVDGGILRTSQLWQSILQAGGGVFPACLFENAASYFVLTSCASSIRYKKDVETYVPGLASLKRLRPVAFTWKSNEYHDLGFIAEEVAEVEPLLVTHNKAGEIEGVKYDRIATVLVNAVKEQQAEIESQTEKLTAQTKEIDALRRQVDSLTKLVCAANAAAEICKPKN